jgi:hypothetical protein
LRRLGPSRRRGAGPDAGHEIPGPVIAATRCRGRAAQPADIALIARTRARHAGVELAEALGRPVDPIGLRTAGEPLRGQILKHGVLVRGKAEVNGRCSAGT